MEKCKYCKYKKDYEYAPSVCKHEGNSRIEYIDERRRIILPYTDEVEACKYFQANLRTRIETWFTERRIHKLKQKYPETFI